jgi:hypothetical protein
MNLDMYMPSMNVSKNTYTGTLNDNEIKKAKNLLQEDISLYAQISRIVSGMDLSVVDNLKFYKKLCFSMYAQPKKIIKELLLNY